ncbi:unnamed protein product [Spodoptera littoralis]|uniref:WKF domain-containing protein n=1 Tax=Spodoptera littoralis TaxID=7109 RepID=A0A9P0I262_SPOLI|nr:unnamed protein product [Spodoptera littoralis]CAH1638802.1 unnamed protein product [Spodoptera littoralis]
MGNNYKKKNKNKKKRLERAKHAGNENPEEQLQEMEDQGNESDGENAGNISISKKRQHEVGDDSDVEDKPQRKKKKKQPIQMDSTDKKGKKSIRQMKREKFAARQAEAQSAAKDQLKSQCLNYLSQWKHDKQNWKFMKARQVWLFKNKFSTHLVPDASWPTLLEYFESAQGNIRNILLEDAHKIIKQMDEWTESQGRETNNDEEDEENEDSEETPKPKKPDDSVYKRARDLIQCLEE